jgi:hypothetical protein
MILGGVGVLASAGIVLVRLAGIFPVVLLGLAVLGLGAFGLTLGILGLLRSIAQKMDHFWYTLSGVVLSALAIILGLTMFIAGIILKVPS